MGTLIAGIVIFASDASFFAAIYRTLETALGFAWVKGPIKDFTHWLRWRALR